MRVLITNYSSAQTVLKAVLIKLGHKYEVAANGNAVIESLQRAAGPRFAILDSNLPGVNGFEICRQLKGSDPDPRLYIILMTRENDRTEVMTALEAGADDYLQKPFDSTELIARLQIAERTLNERAEFQKKLEEAQAQAAALNGNHANGFHLNGNGSHLNGNGSHLNSNGSHLNGNGSHLNGNGLNGAANEGTEPAPESPRVILSVKDDDGRKRKLFSDAHAALNVLQPFDEFEKLIIKTLGDMGLGDASAGDPDAVRLSSDLSIHSVVVLPEKSAWLDVVLDLDRKSAEGLFTTMTGATAETRDELMDMAGEAVNIIQGAIKTALQNGSLEVFTPVIPVKLSPDKRQSIGMVTGECSVTLFTLPGINMTLTLVPHRAPITTKTLEDVKVRDVMVEPVKAPGNKLNLLEKGTMLNAQHIDRLRDIAGYGMTRLKFETISPSELSVLLVKV